MSRRYLNAEHANTFTIWQSYLTSIFIYTSSSFLHMYSCACVWCLLSLVFVFVLLLYDLYKNTFQINEFDPAKCAHVFDANIYTRICYRIRFIIFNRLLPQSHIKPISVLFKHPSDQTLFGQMRE